MICPNTVHRFILFYLFIYLFKSDHSGLARGLNRPPVFVSGWRHCGQVDPVPAWQGTHTWESTDEELGVEAERRRRQSVTDGDSVDTQRQTTVGHDSVHRVPAIITQTELTVLRLQCMYITRLHHRPDQLITQQQPSRYST